MQSSVRPKSSSSTLLNFGCVQIGLERKSLNQRLDSDSGLVNRDVGADAPIVCAVRLGRVSRAELRLAEAGGYRRVFDPAILMYRCVRGGDLVNDAGKGGLEVLMEDDRFGNVVEDFSNHC